MLNMQPQTYLHHHHHLFLNLPLAVTDINYQTKATQREKNRYKKVPNNDWVGYTLGQTRLLQFPFFPLFGLYVSAIEWDVYAGEGQLNNGKTIGPMLAPTEFPNTRFPVYHI